MSRALPDPARLRLFRPEPVPVAIVTGFLGSGKTTLIRRLLTERGLQDTAVLVSEFGEIGLDHLLVEAIDGNVMLLEGGCLCCSHNGDLALALRSLLERRERGEIPHYRRVILETSGLADPGPILQSFMVDPLNLSIYRLAALLAAVDGVEALSTIPAFREAQLQVAMADLIIVTKQDLAGSAWPALQRELARHTAAPILRSFDDLVPERLFSTRSEAGPHYPVGDLVGPRAPDYSALSHPSRFVSYSLRIDHDLDEASVKAWLRILVDRQARPVLRVKAVLPIAGESRPVVLHVVGHRAYRIEYLPEWPSRRRSGAITLIAERSQADVIRTLANQVLQGHG